MNALGKRTSYAHTAHSQEAVLLYGKAKQHVQVLDILLEAQGAGF